MRAALVTIAGATPAYGEFRTPVAPPGKSLLRVTATAISHVTRSRAAGTHYSAPGELPFIPGIDGTGIGEDGRHYYFVFPEPPFGAMAEYCVSDDSQCFALPDGLSDITAAAMAIPGMSSWAALVERARLSKGETVLINGATGVSGRLAIQIAKHLGARKVIATGRQEQQFAALRELGADVTLSLVQSADALEAAFKDLFRQRVDVVLDYVWGPSAQAAIVAAAKASPAGVPIRFVQIGSIGGSDITLPGAALRSTALQLMGSGIGSVPLPRMFQALRGVLEAAPAAGFKVAARAVPLADVNSVWADDARERVVLVP